MNLAAILALVEQYGPVGLSLIEKYGPLAVRIISQHGDAIVRAAGTANTVLKTLEGKPEAGVTAVMSFASNLIKVVPELKEFEPAVLRGIQNNADAAINLQQGGG